VRYVLLTLQRSKSATRVLRRSLWLLLIPPGVTLAAGPARLEKTFDTTRTPQVILSNLRGQVLVRGWEKAQVHAVCVMVSPRVEVDTEALPRTGAAERVQFATHVLDPLVTGNEETANCTLEVPLGASVEIRNRQGGVQIENLQGQHAHVESADGLISAKDVTGHLMARSLGGDIQIVRASGRVEAVSITGSIRIIAPASKNLRANTNSGQIMYQGDFVPAGEYILSSYSGDIELLCPPSASFELNARSVKGKLHNAFPLAPKRHAPFPVPAANSLLGTRNTGNATVELTSFSGAIWVREQP
jgi:DUF4097 and DUF4098 domain-containing protein YvlB